jgi:4-amino-4-deoxy-L-arabinose transferase-like glycosyltransferase
MNLNIFLSFSDAAKYADVARNLVQSGVFGSLFSLNAGTNFEQIGKMFFTSYGVLPVMPVSIAAFFKVFGVSDFAVIATSFFFFLLTLVFVFLLAEKVFSNSLVGILSTVAVAFNYDLIHYATSGASESPFAFEIVAGAYFLSLRRKWATVVGFVLMVLLYFTRSQGFIYIAGLLLLALLINFRTKKAIILFFSISALYLIFDRVVLWPLSGKYFIYPITGKGINALTQYSADSAISDTLRGQTPMAFSIISAVKKVFYNLYNFYKLLPQIINPYLFTLFVIGIFRWGKDKRQKAFKVSAVFVVITTLLVTAASIPFFRYIHPIIPFVYIIAVGILVEIIELGFKNYDLRKRQIFINLTSLFLILVFAVGQTLGILLLDSRFERNTHNIGKPPVYAQLSYVLRDNTNKDKVVLTNLDTWGTWYGERKTVWFPLEPKQIIDPATGKIPFDAIYLTSYLIDDPNYYMGADWRMVFDNPQNPDKWVCDGCGEIAKEFTLKNVYSVPASDNYERQDAKAVLLIKR